MKRIGWFVGLLSLVLVPLFVVRAADTTKPTFQYFFSETPDGTYGAGTKIVFGALYSEFIKAGSTLTVVLNTTPVQKEIVLNTVSGFKVSGTYTVAPGDNSALLKVVRIKAGTESVRDNAGNVRTDTPSSAYAGSKNIDNPEKIVIDTTAPLAPVASPDGGVYKVSRNITLSVAGEPSTTKIYYTLNGTNPTVTSPRYNAPFLITSSKTIKAVAKDAAGNVSPIMTKVYVIDTTVPTPTPTSTPTQTPTSTYIPNPYDTQTPPPNGYDAQTITPNPYTNPYTNPIVTALTAIITSPANNAFFAQKQNIPVAVSGNGTPTCGTWTLTKPNGQIVTLTAADFENGKLPGNIPNCDSDAYNPSPHAY